MNNIFSFAHKGLAFAKAHKVVSAIILIALAGVAWWGYGQLAQTSAQTRYVLGEVERGTIVSTVSGSGQVSASNEVDLTAGVSGNVISVPVTAGQTVKKGQLIAQVDPGDAAYEVETAQLSYQDLVTIDPADVAKAQTDVEDAYTDARATLTTTSSGLSDELEDLKSFFGKSGYLTSQNYSRNAQEKSYRDQAEKSYYIAQDAQEAFNTTVRSVTVESSHAAIQAAVSQGYEAALLVAQAAKDAKDAVAYIREHDDLTASAADDAYTLAGTTVTAANSSVSGLASARDAVKDADDALADLINGPDTLELRQEELSLRQKEDALADYSIRAPFDGVVATLSVHTGDTMSSNSAVATLITQQQVAELSLNEVDAAKVHAGAKATLTFDAIEDLTLTGEVVEVDAIGTVSQGVVSYTVKIGFDTQDDRIKPGMTANATIQTEVRQDALIVPSSAVKTQSGVSYVLVFSPALTDTGGTQGVTTSQEPQMVEVETGISDDTNVEILSDLEEGQQIVIKTTTTTTTTTTTSSNGSSFGGGGIRF